MIKEKDFKKFLDDKKLDLASLGVKDIYFGFEIYTDIHYGERFHYSEDLETVIKYAHEQLKGFSEREKKDFLLVYEFWFLRNQIDHYRSSILEMPINDRIEQFNYAMNADDIADKNLTELETEIRDAIFEQISRRYFS